MAIKFDWIPTKHTQPTTKINDDHISESKIFEQPKEDNHFERDPTFSKLSQNLDLFLMSCSLHVESS